MSKLKTLGVVVAILGGLTSGYAAAMLPADGPAFNQCIGHKLFAAYNQGWGWKFVSLNACC